MWQVPWHQCLAQGHALLSGPVYVSAGSRCPGAASGMEPMKPMKPTLHLIYAVPYRAGRVRRSYDYAQILVRSAVEGAAWMPWRDGELQLGRSIVHAPDSITVHLTEHFRGSYEVRLYDWNERYGVVACGEHDIVIGHVTPRGNGPMNRVLRSRRPARAKIMLQPFSHGLVEENYFTLPYVPLSDAYAAICGTYWLDTLAVSPFGPSSAKFQRVDMAIDAAQYPYLRRSFNPPGQRRILYIGHNLTASKGCVYLSTLARSLPDVDFGWIGNGEPIDGVEHISPNRELTPEFMAAICERYDFFITMGVSDANPTTILEAMAWGLPVLCTPQSGYYNMATIFNVLLDDPVFNRQLITTLQAMPAAELLRLAVVNRELVCGTYTWSNFLRRVDSIIEAVAR